MRLITVASILFAALSDGDVKAVVWLSIGAVTGVILFLRGFRMLQYKRLILNTPFSKIRSASMGLVEVCGAAQGPRTVPAGITGQACYYYRATVWQLKQAGKNSQWKRVAQETLSVPFYAEDSTGRLLVDPQGAQLDLPPNFKEEFDTSFFSNNSDMLPENIAQFLNRNDITFSSSIRVEELAIKPDSPLFVFGTLARNSGELSWTPTAHVPMETSLHASLNFFGVGGAGGILPWLGATSRPSVQTTRMPAPASAAPALASAVWSTVSMDEESEGSAGPRSAAARSASAQAGSAVATAEPDDAPSDDAPTSAPGDAGAEPCPPVAICKGPGSEPFMISAHSQREVVRSLAWKSALYIWGGPALTLTCFYLLAEILGWT